MSDHFYPQTLFSLLIEILDQIETRNDILALPRELLFNPDKHTELRTKRYGQILSTPYGVAAGPHTQLARNIISAWLMGARYMELKTIQTLDELKVKKPCIDMQDEGYNCEWSQELKVEQSFNEYLNAWIIIHVLAHKLKFKNGPETIFNMSVGYDLKGILTEKVQWFFDQMNHAGSWIDKKKKEIESIYPEIDVVNIPSQISNNVTLSTMHGCPSDEVEQISKYLIQERKYHTTVKLNPTLLGADLLRNILNTKLNYPIEVPDLAFIHDLKYRDAVPMIRNLRELSIENELEFSIKLTNTLEVNNKLGILPEDMVYLSGRALHPISVNLAANLQKEFDGELDICFSGGADAFNLPNLIKSGLFPVTVSSDLLKPGGYSRLAQYADKLNTGLIEVGYLEKKNPHFNRPKLEYLDLYADEVLFDERYKYSVLDSKNIKSNRSLNRFDCISAPCMDACPTEQDIPDYLYYTSKGKLNDALGVIYQKNPMPRTLGLVCEHSCQAKCTRINYDQTLRIRDIKEFVAKTGEYSTVIPKDKNGLKVAIIGAGPSGLSAAWFLQLEGCEVEIFEKTNRVGGIPKSIIPDFRLNEDALNADIVRILELGVKINFHQDINALDIKKLEASFDYIYLVTGASKNRELNILGIENEVVQDPFEFLEMHKLKKMERVFSKVLIVGGGNTAMDVARMAKKAQNGQGRVVLVYRRTLEQMPAEKQEILDAISEGVEIRELLSPTEIITDDGKVFLKLQAMKLTNEVGSDGRKKVEAVENDFIRMEADCIIPALGQLSVPIIQKFNDMAHPEGIDTELKIFIGGDMSRGGSSIVQAVADGRSFAEIVLKNEELKSPELKEKKGYKLSPHSHLEQRGIRISSDFPHNTSNLLENQAVQEASRCLQCDEYCNICVTVCPNRANQYYHIRPQLFHYSNIEVKGHYFELSKSKTKSISQAIQVYNVADFCNECGNCSTFCPTSGDPFKDKPQIHLSLASYENSERGYCISNDILYYKKQGYSARLIEEAGKFIFEDDRVEVTLAEDSLRILDVFIKEEGNYRVDMSLLVEMKIIKESII